MNQLKMPDTDCTMGAIKSIFRVISDFFRLLLFKIDLFELILNVNFNTIDKERLLMLIANLTS